MINGSAAHLEPFALDGNDPLARALERIDTQMDNKPTTLFPLHIDRKPSKLSRIAEPTFMDWLDSNPA